MRLKLYYTADEITNNLYTSGSEWMSEDNIEYRGLYHSYITGEVYTGAIWDSKISKKLIKFLDMSGKNVVYQMLNPKSLVFDAPQPSTPIINQQQIQSGQFNRYFIKKYNDTFILEIDQSQYEKWISKKIDSVIYLAITIPWTITGPIDDEISNGTLIKGIKNKNLLQITSANKKMPGLSNFLTNPLQYYTDTDFVVPKDINA
jgi:hypothetical protein